MKALLLLNLQNDYLPGGAVGVAKADLLIPLANKLQGSFKMVVATQDWHPAIHRSFVVHHPGRKPGEVIQLRKQTLQLQPVHCVQNTRGAELASALMLNRVNKVVRQGTDPELDDYSGFFDDGHLATTGLHEYLKEKKVTALFVMGLVLERGVKNTVLDAVGLGFATFLIEDACAASNPMPEQTGQIMDEVKRAGVNLVRSADVLRAIY